MDIKTNLIMCDGVGTLYVPATIAHQLELVRDGFKQVAAISCRFNNPISRKTRLNLARVTFKPFRSTFTIGK